MLLDFASSIFSNRLRELHTMLLVLIMMFALVILLENCYKWNIHCGLKCSYEQKHFKFAYFSLSECFFDKPF